MKKYYFLIAMVLTAIGVFFLFKQFPIPFIGTPFGGVSLFAFLTVALFIHARRVRETPLLFFQAMVLLILWQLFAETNIAVWPEHWSMYIVYIGIALMLSRKVKIGLLPLAVGLGILLVPAIESLFFWVPPVVTYIKMYFSILFLLLGGYYFYKQK
ncbi:MULTISPECIES: hypothetical protein [Salimicrobium]|uniref:Uncharacterized protein n=3 Tax=Salimicrobium TaxID=351195 RepID=K2FMR3_9BACI|nr:MULTISPECIES: hypothetical protein [Salimicrobium]AKG04200.1 hypothetical protein AAV35_005000 [Salimicrobium jeotgali]EKE32166.1 hypothetical protein MJ3_04319 [Salimicrobium jeotgali]MBM7695777.1 hypothetical protein [Salimicrobium jeotgali]SDX63667.1 hypothetical protein SAMN04488081_0897 [Salimicrobium album]SIS50631.1 hypothetical protein SAMN05421758_10296 [Salimicrobium salexigens]